MASLDEFKEASGLSPSLSKNTAYFCNILNSVKLAILNILPFEEGQLPVKYLGVPLISSRLVNRDCKLLVEKVQKMVNDWRNKYLSFADRVQLINSVLSSIHVYWSSVFILPMSIILDVEQIMRGFLWCQGDMQKGKAKVSWDDACLPKEEGGLGIRKLRPFNVALFSVHIWNVLTNKESLWVKWIHTHKLRGTSFWNLPYRGNLSWSWRKMLQIRPIIRQFIWTSIGNGEKTSAWHDNWCTCSPLYDKLSSREITSAGFSFEATVSVLVSNGQWQTPTGWLTRFPSFTVPPALSNVDDSLFWKDRNGVAHTFSVNVVWEDLRPRKAPVEWSNLVWFNYCIPGHAFVLWLVFWRRLKTQDLLMQWDVNPNLDLLCPLCMVQPDSHSHLFFECSYSSQVWNKVCTKAGLQPRPHAWNLIVDRLLPKANKKSMENVIDKLALAATVYLIWQERNTRLFMKTSRSTEVLADLVFSTLRLKMLTFKYKRKSTVEKLIAAWDLPVSLIISA